MANLRVNNIVGVGSTNAGVVFDGVTKIKTQNYFYLQTGNTDARFPNFATNAVSADSARGIFMGGSSPAPALLNVIDYITISTTGNAIDFGDLTEVARWTTGSVSSSTRGIRAGGFNPSTSPTVPSSNVIDYVTISSTGNAQDFGDLTTATATHGGCSNSTRGIFAGGNPLLTSTKINVIQYITQSSLGNSSDFGDLSSVNASLKGLSSPVRGIFAGGYTPTQLNTIEFVTISSTGNSQDFGDLLFSRSDPQTFSSSTRGIIIGGNTSSITADYITISTSGIAFNFGSCTSTRASAGAVSSIIRGVFSACTPTPGVTNTLEYLTIASQSNSLDFGDLTVERSLGGGCSNGHGGLG